MAKLRDKLIVWLEDNLYMGSDCARSLADEVYSPTCMVIWAMATKTQGFADDHIGTATKDSLGTQFLVKAVKASAKLWTERYKLRDRASRRRHGVDTAGYMKSLRGRTRGQEGEEDAGSGGEEPSDEILAMDEDEEEFPHFMEL